jgi:hypothetical protein
MLFHELGGCCLDPPLSSVFASPTHLDIAVRLDDADQRPVENVILISSAHPASSSSSPSKRGRQPQLVPDPPWHAGTGENLSSPLSSLLGATKDVPDEHARKEPDRYAP